MDFWHSAGNLLDRLVAWFDKIYKHKFLRAGDDDGK